MKHGFKNIAVGSATVALLVAGSAGAANASYLGYGNGDPGNWGFYQEQHPHHAMAQMKKSHPAVTHRFAAAQEKKQS